MGNEFTDALGELQEAQTEAFGTPCEARIGTQTVPCVLLEEPFNPIIAPDGGGTSQSGRQTIMVNKSLLTSFVKSPNGEPPINITPTVILGIKAFVLSVSNKLGVLYIETGFPEAEE